MRRCRSDERRATRADRRFRTGAWILLGQLVRIDLWLSNFGCRTDRVDADGDATAARSEPARNFVGIGTGHHRFGVLVWSRRRGAWFLSFGRRRTVDLRVPNLVDQHERRDRHSVLVVAGVEIRVRRVFWRHYHYRN